MEDPSPNLNRRNAASYDYDIRFDPETGEPRLSRGDADSIPLLPTIGARFRL